MSYKWPGIPNGDYSFDHGRAVWNRIINFLRRLCEKLDGDLVDATSDRRGLMTAKDKAAFDAIPETYETQEHAAATYETQDHAAATYETQDHAADTYETKTHASATYETKGNAITGLSASGTTVTYTKGDGTTGTFETQDHDTIYTHPTYTARTGKPTADQMPGFGGTVTVSQIETDATGHVTAANDKTITIPATEASSSAAGLMSATDKSKLDGIATSAEVNQNAFSSVLVGNTNVAADAKSDTLTLVAGTGITLTPDATNDKITIAVTSNTYAAASHTHSYLPLSGGTLTGALTFANGTWNTVGDDVKIGDVNKGGTLGVMGTNGATTIAFFKQNDTSNYKTISYDGTTLQVNGNSATASKLATARTISAGDLEYEGSASFDGSDNVNLNVTPYKAIVSIGNTNNYPFHYIGTTGLITGSYLDSVITLLVGRDYINGGGGICRIEVRANQVSAGALATAKVKWLIRDPDLPVDSIQVGFRDTSGDTIADIFYHSAGTYSGAMFRVLGVGRRTSIARTFTLVDSTEVNNTTTSSAGASVNSFKTIAAAATALHSTKPYTSTIIASDVGIVKTATDVSNHTHADYVQKTGDTMSGTLNFSSTNPHITANASGKNAQLFIQSAVSHLDGAWLRLDGRNNDWPGAFQLGASDGTNTYQLDGTPDGNLHWYGLGLESDGKIIASTFQGDLFGNATTATTLKNTRTIDGVNFNGSANITHYGICSTAAATAAKTVSCTGFVLATGARIIVKFANANTNVSPTLNVNSTGAKAIKYRNATVTANSIKANSLYEFVYDGSAYQLVGTLEEIIARSLSFDATYITTNNSAIVPVPGGTIINFVLQTTTALSGTYTSYNIGTYTNPGSSWVRFLLTRQDNGLSIPAVINVDGHIRIEQKSIKGDNTWLWGGVFVPNN